MTGILVGLLALRPLKSQGVLLRLCGPVSTLPGLLKVGNMSVGNMLEVTNPIYINHMIVLTTVDSSSLSYWLPFFLDGQCELHHFALVFLQLILDCHLSLPFPCGLLHFLKVSPNLFFECRSVLLHFLEVSINLYFNGRILLYFLKESLSLFLQSRIISQDSLDASGRPLIDAELLALLLLPKRTAP